MSISVRLDWLMDYSDHERRKWFDWFRADPGRLRIPVQPGGRFPTAADLLDHIVLVERRHLCRLEGGTPPNATGVPPGDLDSLVEYADLVRADLRRYLDDLDETRADEGMILALSIGNVPSTPRKLLAHVVLHDVRHFAQLALAARQAGHAPPGDHDILMFAGKGSGVV